MDDKNLPLLDQLIEAGMRQLAREERMAGNAPAVPPRRTGSPRPRASKSTAARANPKSNARQGIPVVETNRKSNVRQDMPVVETQKISFEHTIKAAIEEILGRYLEQARDEIAEQVLAEVRSRLATPRRGRSKR